MKRKIKPFLLLLCFSTTSVFAHGLMSGNLENAVTHIDQVVLAKIISINTIPRYHTLKDGTQGSLLTTRCEYTLEINRILARRPPSHEIWKGRNFTQEVNRITESIHNKIMVTYTTPQFVFFDENDKVKQGIWIKTHGTGKESRLEQGQEYVLCLRSGGGGQPPSIIRAESIEQINTVIKIMEQKGFDIVNLQINNIDKIELLTMKKSESPSSVITIKTDQSCQNDPSEQSTKLTSNKNFYRVIIITFIIITGGVFIWRKILKNTMKNNIVILTIGEGEL